MCGRDVHDSDECYAAIDSDVWTMERRLQRIPVGAGERIVLIEGEARGADQMARDYAIAHGWPVDAYPAKWKEYGKAAGMIRNHQMLDEGKPDLVIAFHRDIEHSRGTKDMVLRAHKAGIKVEVIG